MKLLNNPFKLEDLIIKHDETTGMIAIIAIHNTKRGPALGGCRFVNYQSVDAAINDAVKLAEAMTYKSSMANLPLGGGKSVVIAHPKINDRQKVFDTFGILVESLQGKYITAIDSGTSEDDMKIIATNTKHVTSIRSSDEFVDNTAGMTALGVTRAMEAAAKVRFGSDSLAGIHVAIQGVGNVGFLLAQMLIERKAKITITDNNEVLLAQRAHELNLSYVKADEIVNFECDIFSPCALGGILNATNIQTLKAQVVCGAANNQLQCIDDGEILRQKNILYVPDYVANAGGLICAARQAAKITKEEAVEKVQEIYQTVLGILQISNDAELPTNKVANSIAEKNFA